MASKLTSTFSKLSTFGHKVKRDEDDAGEAIEADSVAGGGHGARQSRITKEQLRISHALRAFLVNEKILSPDDVANQDSGALKELLDQPHIEIPKRLLQRGRPITEYFMASSHNTYLLRRQLYGDSSAVAYETALQTGSRCVEIDAWNGDNKEEPKVTHGYTLASHISFRSVCETIRDVVDKEARTPLESGHRPAPIMISLENHCDAYGQQRLADIMKEVWGDRLLSKPVRDHGTREQNDTGEHVTLEELGSKIAVIVEYHLPNEKDVDSSSSDEEEDEEDEVARRDHRKYRDAKKNAASSGIIPELAELGVYAQSVKPANNSWFENVLEHGPHHHLINVSESGLLAVLPKYEVKISQHNSRHLIRVYPKGTRIGSNNLNPVPFWGVGAQICALNWQTFDASMQLSEALFAGSDGWVLKPDALRAGGSGKLSTGRVRRLRLHIAGATDVPIPKERDDGDEIKPYVSCTLIHPDDRKNTPPKKKTSGYRQHKHKIMHKGEQPPPTDPIWDETLEWTYDENELTFLRILIKSDDKFARNPVICVAAVRLAYVTREWVFIRMLDLKGRETHCTILVKFDDSYAPP